MRGKRGILVPTISLALLGLVIFAFIVRDRVADDSKVKGLGETSLDLIWRDQELDKSSFFYHQKIKHASYSVLDDFLKRGGLGRVKDGIWDFDPSDGMSYRFENELSEAFVFDDEVDFPSLSGDKVVTILQNDGFFLIDVVYVKPLVSEGSGFSQNSEISYNRTFRTVVKINFDLDIFNDLYTKYSKSEHCPIQDNEYDIECSEEGGFLNFVVRDEDLGFFEPELKFKIRKPGKIF